MKTSTKQGFTLIELLIVITIIGILAVALLPRILNGPARARDAARKASLSQIAGAIEAYYNDKGSYPSSGGDGTHICTNSNSFKSELQSYLQGGQIPADPLSTASITDGGGTGTDCTASFSYTTLAANGVNGASYMLIAQTELDGTGSEFGILTTLLAAADMTAAQSALQAGCGPVGATCVYALAR